MEILFLAGTIWSQHLCLYVIFLFSCFKGKKTNFPNLGVPRNQKFMPSISKMGFYQSIDPDGMPEDAAAHQSLHYL